MMVAETKGWVMRFCCILAVMMVGVSFSARAEEGKSGVKLDDFSREVIAYCGTSANMARYNIEPMYRSGMTKKQIYASLDFELHRKKGSDVFYNLADRFEKQPLMSDQAAFAQVMQDCMDFEGFKYPAGVKKELFYQIPPSETGPAIYSLGNTDGFPLNMALSSLVFLYPDAECMDWRGQKMCDVKSGQTQHGLDVDIGLRPPFTAYFRGSDNAHARLSGFTQEKDAAEWKVIFDHTKAVYGSPKVENHPAGAGIPMSSTIYKWELKLGEFSMVRFGGQDVYGSPIDRHEIGFEAYPLPKPDAAN